MNVATPLEAATDVAPPAKLPEDGATEMVSFDPVPLETTLPSRSSTATPTDTDWPAVMVEAGWLVTANWLAAPAPTVITVVVAESTGGFVVSDAPIVSVPEVEIWSPLKVATPLVAATDVVPPEKVPVESVSFTVSLEPAFPVVMVLPN